MRLLKCISAYIHICILTSEHVCAYFVHAYIYTGLHTYTFRWVTPRKEVRHLCPSMERSVRIFLHLEEVSKPHQMMFRELKERNNH